MKKLPKPHGIRQVGISTDIHKRVRIMATQTNKSMREYVERALLAALPRVNK